ncbi:MAG: tetratricopeptide repeat protein [bacterium]
MRKNPEDLALSNRLAETYAMAREFEHAVKLLRATLAQGGGKMMIYNNLGNVYFLQGYSDSALVNYLKALSFGKTSADSAGIYHNLAALFAADTLLADTVGGGMGLLAEISQQWEVRAVDGKNKGYNKNQKGKSGSKPVQGKQKMVPGGKQANAGPIDVQIPIHLQMARPDTADPENIGAVTGLTFHHTSRDSNFPPWRSEFKHDLYWAKE